MIQQELAIKLARMGSMRRWDPQVQIVYDDRRVPAYTYIEERLRRYDRALFLRFNALAERWELFRWRGLLPPSRRARARMPAEEMAARSLFLWTLQEKDGSYMEPDQRLVRKIVLGDTYAKCGSSSAKALDEMMMREDKEEERRNKQEIREWTAEDAGRLAHDARKLTGHHKVFSHGR